MRRHRPEAAERGIGWIGGFEKILSVGVYPDGIGPLLPSKTLAIAAWQHSHCRHSPKVPQTF